jgi:uncharacterized membrane protein
VMFGAQRFGFTLGLGAGGALAWLGGLLTPLSYFSCSFHLGSARYSTPNALVGFVVACVLVSALGFFGLTLNWHAQPGKSRFGSVAGLVVLYLVALVMSFVYGPTWF